MAISTATTPAGAEPLEIRQRVEAAIAPWRCSDEKPPFSPEQLVVLALLVHGGEAPIDDIHLWVLETIRWYRKQAALQLSRSHPRDDNFSDYSHFLSHDRPKHANHHPALNLASGNFEAPLYRELKNGVYYRSVSLLEGEQMLGSTLPSRDGAANSTFNFFGLPAELREAIYEMIFAYPKSGLGIVDESSPGFRMVSTSWVNEFSWEAWKPAQRSSSTGSPKIETMPMRDILRPLLTNKQFYIEASPVFTRINLFHCKNIESLTRMLNNIAPQRLQHVTSISFCMTGQNQHAAKLFTKLAQVKHLRRLDIMLAPSEERWLARWRPEGHHLHDKKFESVMNMRGVPELRSIRSLEAVTFTGSPTFERILKPEMLKPKVEKKSNAGGKKRKLDSRDDGAAVGSERTKRKG